MHYNKTNHYDLIEFENKILEKYETGGKMIKILACLFMLIDHIGLVLIPQYKILRLLGRLSMPFYAYCIARGIKYTKSIDKYLKRVLRIALVSEIPFIIMEKEIKLNICFLWGIGIWTIVTIEKMKEWYKKLILIIITLFFISFLNIDYGAYGLLYLLLMFYIILNDKYRNNDIVVYSSWSLLHIVKIICNSSAGIMQVFTLLTIPIIDICNRYGLEEKKINSWIINFFYPVHMIILLVIKYVFIV